MLCLRMSRRQVRGVAIEVRKQGQLDGHIRIGE